MLTLPTPPFPPTNIHLNDGVSMMFCRLPAGRAASTTAAAAGGGLDEGEAIAGHVGAAGRQAASVAA